MNTTDHWFSLKRVTRRTASLFLSLTVITVVLFLPTSGNSLNRIFGFGSEATGGDSVFVLNDGTMVLSDHGGLLNFTKFNLDGTFAFSKNVYNTNQGWPHRAVRTSDGGYLVSGVRVGDRPQQGFVIKLHGNLDFAWGHQFSHTDIHVDMWAGAARQTSDGGYIVLVKGQPADQHGSDRFFGVIKLNANGGVAWKKRLTFFYQTDVYDIEEASDGYIIYGAISVGKNPDDPNEWNWDLYLARISKDGNDVMGQFSIGGDAFDGSFTIEPQIIGNTSNLCKINNHTFAIAAYTNSAGTNPGSGCTTTECVGKAIILAVFDSGFSTTNGQTSVNINAKLLDGPGDDRVGNYGGPNLLFLSDDNLLLGGYTKSTSGGHLTAFLAKISPFLNQVIWKKGYLMGTESETSFIGGMAMGLAEIPATGEILVTGKTGGSPSTAFLLGIDQDGNYEPSCCYGWDPVSGFNLAGLGPDIGMYSGEFVLADGGAIVVTSIGSSTTTATNFNLICYPDVSVSQAQHSLVDYGTIDLGQSSSSQSFTISNSAGVPGRLIVSDVMWEGNDQLQFSRTLGTCSTSWFDPGENCSLTTGFSPSTAGVKDAFLRIYSNDPDTPVWEIPLKGTGRSTLAVSISGTGPGAVTGGGINCNSNGGTCTEKFTSATTVTLTASPQAGSIFTGWSGVCTGTNTTCQVSTDVNRTVTASFQGQYTLSVAISPPGGGTVTFDPQGGAYDPGTPVTLTAHENPGYRFDHWDGDATGNGSSTSVTMNDDKSVTAYFIRRYTLSTDVSPAGAGSVQPPGGTYDNGTSVPISANAASGWQFDRWDGDASGTNPQTQITMDGDKFVTAIFVRIQYTLTVQISPPGAGYTTPGGGTYDAGSSTDLEAKHYAGYRFDYWGGDLTGSQNPATVTMDGNKSITAHFVQQFDLTLVKAGIGTGTVTIAPPGVDCDGTCTGWSHTYDAATLVALTAAADPGHVFAGWSGAGCSGTGPCNVTMDGAKTVTATFVNLLISPAEGTIGTELVIKGSGFGTKKGKVLLDTVSLKVAFWEDQEIRCVLSKAMPVDTKFNVTVQPKEPKGVGPIIEEDAFTMRAPEITSAPEGGKSGDPTALIIKGDFFSNKKGKVTLEYDVGGVTKKKTCKVLSWPADPGTGTVDGEIQFTVPKGLAAGDAYTLRITNKVGSDTVPFKINL